MRGALTEDGYTHAASETTTAMKGTTILKSVRRIKYRVDEWVETRPNGETTKGASICSINHREIDKCDKICMHAPYRQKRVCTLHASATAAAMNQTMIPNVRRRIKYRMNASKRSMIIPYAIETGRCECVRRKNDNCYG